MAILDTIMSSAITPALEFCKNHATELLIGVGVGGFVGAVVSGIRATRRAVVVEQVEENNRKAPLSTKERIRLVGKMYIPTILLVLISGACIILGVTRAIKANAALTVALASSERALAEYKESVKVLTDPDKVSEIDQVFNKTVNMTPEDAKKVHGRESSIDQNVPISNSSTEFLCRDDLAERYFVASQTDIDKAINMINRDIQHEYWRPYNDFYEAMGLSPNKVGNNYGWNSSMPMITPHYSYGGAPDGRPCMVVSFTPAPSTTYQNG